MSYNEFIHLNSILRGNSIIHHLPETLQEEEISLTVYNLSNIFWNKNFNYHDTVNCINIKY